MSDIWYMVFGSISYHAEKKRIKYSHSLKQFHQELSASLSNIPPEKQLEPSFQITAQALENAKYCINENELREMFTSLISNSMNSDFLQDIHPSFAEIIKQMSVIDARILKKFKGKYISGIPICHYQIESKTSKGYITVLKNAFLEYPEASLELCSQSLSSLTRLGLLEIPYAEYLDLPDYYEQFKHHPYFFALEKSFPDKNVTIQKSVARLSPLGCSFIKVCIPD